ncbi:hypothetical protein ACFYO1_34405 [Nocardia sp. NPDC006044]|uniref:hypothetical protein n=1 Tax=Nocardia sp. NPDC006044 TaxID=3364306 RepID=UPI0036747171
MPLDNSLGPVTSASPAGDGFFVDLVRLGQLAEKLDGHAEAVLAIRINTAVRMPNSALQEPLSRVNRIVSDAYTFIGGHIKTMSKTMSAARQSFSGMERANAEQLGTYLRGQA